MNSSLNNLFESMFKSKTISPNYRKPHIVHAILLMGEDDFGIGRYRIMKELNLGEGSIKTMLARFRDENLIDVQQHRQQGQKLTPKGKQVYQDIISYFSHPRELDNSHQKFVIGENAVFSIISANKLNETPQFGIPQRDEAIKIGAQGASCMIFNGKNLIFPNSDDFTVSIPELDSNKLHSGDVVVIGGGPDLGTATLGLIAAILSLIDLKK